MKFITIIVLVPIVLMFIVGEAVAKVVARTSPTVSSYEVFHILDGKESFLPHWDFWENATRNVLQLRGNAYNFAQYNDIRENSLLNPENHFDVKEAGNTMGMNLALDVRPTEEWGGFLRGKVEEEFAKYEFAKSDEEFKNNIEQAYLTKEMELAGIASFISVGKQRIKWGNGMFWNPVDTFNPRQDMQNFEKITEGKVCYHANFILDNSFACTLVVVPDATSKAFSYDNFIFSDRGDTLIATRIEALFRDTELFFHFSKKEKEEPRYGVSFSSVIADVQFFGEAVYWRGESERLYPSLFSPRQTQYDPIGMSSFSVPASYRFENRKGTFYKLLLGFQYTFPDDTTMVIEYFYNGDGYEQAAMDLYTDFLRYAGNDYTADVNSVLAAKQKNPLLQLPMFPSASSLLALGNGIYDFANLRKNYLHLFLHKPYVADRFRIELDAIINLDEISRTDRMGIFLKPSITYTGIPNWNFRLQAHLYSGADDTEFGMSIYRGILFAEACYFF